VIQNKLKSSNSPLIAGNKFTLTLLTTRKKLFRDQFLATKWNGC